MISWNSSKKPEPRSVDAAGATVYPRHLFYKNPAASTVRR